MTVLDIGIKNYFMTCLKILEIIVQLLTIEPIDEIYYLINNQTHHNEKTLQQNSPVKASLNMFI